MQQFLRDVQADQLSGGVQFFAGGTVPAVVGVVATVAGQGAGGFGDARVVVAEGGDDLADFGETGFGDRGFDVLAVAGAHREHDQRRIVGARILADGAPDTLHDVDLGAARFPEQHTVEDRDVDAFGEAACVGHQVEPVVVHGRQAGQRCGAIGEFHVAVDVFGGAAGQQHRPGGVHYLERFHERPARCLAVEVGDHRMQTVTAGRFRQRDD